MKANERIKKLNKKKIVEELKEIIISIKRDPEAIKQARKLIIEN